MNFVINQTHNRKKKYTLLSFFYQNRIFAVENSNLTYKYSNLICCAGYFFVKTERPSVVTEGLSD